MKKFIEIAEANGWGVVEVKGGLELCWESNFGRDFCVAINGETIKELTDDVLECWECFDVNDDVKMYLENGCKLRILDLVKDSKECKYKVYNLYHALMGWNEKAVSRYNVLKASEVIKQLNDLIYQYGDQDVTILACDPEDKDSEELYTCYDLSIKDDPDTNDFIIWAN